MKYLTDETAAIVWANAFARDQDSEFADEVLRATVERIGRVRAKADLWDGFWFTLSQDDGQIRMLREWVYVQCAKGESA